MDNVQEIKEKLDIVDVIRDYITLHPAGKNFKALCPFHQEKTPSFIVSPDRQTWHCFGQCNEGGDVISFVMKYENVSFYDALKHLAEKAGVTLKGGASGGGKELGVLYDINATAVEFFANELVAEKSIQDYLSSRGLTKETCEEFSIGFAPNNRDKATVYLINVGYRAEDVEKAGISFKTQRGTFMDRFRGRIMFPLANIFGKTVGFSGRIAPVYEDEKTAKYINSPETSIYTKSKILYGLSVTKPYIKEERSVLLVEGNMDMLMLYQDGVRNVVAVAGTALTSYHLHILSRIADTLILAFDNDDAGIAATERAIDMAHQMDFSVRVVMPEKEKDFADYVKEHPGGAKHFIATHTTDAADFYFHRYLDGGKTDKKNIRALLSKAAQLYSPMDRYRWIRRIAEKTGISEKALTEEMELFLAKTTANTTAKSEQKEEAQSSENIEFSFKSRYEQLALNVLSIYAMGDGAQKEMKEHEIYFPPRFASVFRILMGEDIGDDDVAIHNLVAFIEMRGSLREFPDEETRLAEMVFLLDELKKEYLKQKQSSIMKTIKEHEEAGKEADKELLEEFNRVTRLLNS